MRILLLALILAIAVCAPARGMDVCSAPIELTNSSFEEFRADGSPCGWSISRTPSSGYRFRSAPGMRGKGLRVQFLGGQPNESWRASIFQGIDATRYRGQLVSYRIRVRVLAPGHQIGPFLTVTRPEPRSAGFAEEIADHPTAGAQWRTYRIVGRVAADAIKIWIGVKVTGAADVVIDESSIQTVGRDPKPPSPAAEDYLMAAVKLLRQRHIGSADVDWPRIISEARADIGGAVAPSDTYFAIRGILGELGNPHSYLLPPPRSAAAGSNQSTSAQTRPPPLSPMPTGRIEGRIAILELPSLNTLGPEGSTIGSAYASALRVAIETLDKMRLCGWIIDLRRNGGGNMWPMLQGLDPLLGDPPFGYFSWPGRLKQSWVRLAGTIASSAETVPYAPPAYTVVHADAPVAILLGPDTASSGEMTALAMIGRPEVRSFGSATAGLTTGNTALRLPDGALLVVTETLASDRTGREYFGPILPESVVEPGSAMQAAKSWLEARCDVTHGLHIDLSRASWTARRDLPSNDLQMLREARRLLSAQFR